MARRILALRRQLATAPQLVARRRMGRRGFEVRPLAGRELSSPRSTLSAKDAKTPPPPTSLPPAQIATDGCDASRRTAPTISRRCVSVGVHRCVDVPSEEYAKS